jgi:hypothetical protein
MEAIAGDEPRRRSSLIGLQIHFENSAQQLNGLVLHTMILIAQRFPFFDMKNFPDVPVRVGPYELMSPWFNDYSSFVGDGLHCQGATITDSRRSENDCDRGTAELSLAAQTVKVNVFPRCRNAKSESNRSPLVLEVQDPENQGITGLPPEWNGCIPNNSESSTF